ncbi:RNA 2',3'-cyclic phosphodiesterase [Salipiger sp. PrR002]|uniref:RNA 2',3'-cyclic phosphodiesterase n=1 Tax=Salipiger sp. PrR002 TaxID=2706489 RepID=UPI0013B83C6B|nr:RNA 2',3'-cyclic phosphodiesterase [Salipiger sp. PrR002]NDW00751.1 RNA 2',3'-cyclic phosphodiesterase [Salipiger sp. PrR002]NDW58420.1 RNA 2',3'-cyclic phosphodiesterase [Salipiger sp. PrR004]
MRCFLALPLPEALIAPLLAVQGAVPVGRAVPEENLHVTLAFLGEVAEADLRELDLELGGAALPGCFLQVAGLESFGGRAPKLLAAALRPDPGLLALHGRVARACRAAGIELERRRFRPHVTLLRFGAGLRGDGIARLERAVAGLAGLTTGAETGTETGAKTGAVAAEVLRLVASTLTPEGALYETLAAYPLPPPSGAAGSGEERSGL